MTKSESLSEHHCTHHATTSECITVAKANLVHAVCVGNVATDKRYSLRTSEHLNLRIVCGNVKDRCRTPPLRPEGMALPTPLTTPPRNLPLFVCKQRYSSAREQGQSTVVDTTDPLGDTSRGLQCISTPISTALDGATRVKKSTYKPRPFSYRLGHRCYKSLQSLCELECAQAPVLVRTVITS